MSTNTGNATQIQTYADFSGRVSSCLWPAVKDRMTAEQMSSITNSEIIEALRRALCNSSALAHVPLAEMNGVWISDNAKALFNGTLGTVCKTESEELPKSLSDHEIIEKYGEDIIFDSIDDLEVTIADLISKQSGGKSGKLLSNVYTNIFYVRVNGSVTFICVTFASAPLSSDDPEWYVGSDRIDGGRWYADRRVFRNCGHSDTEA